MTILLPASNMIKSNKINFLLFFIIQLVSFSAVAQISTDFSDGTWGQLSDEQPISGEFPSSEPNGFVIRKGILSSGTMSSPEGHKHTNRILLDKNSTRAYIALPTLQNVGILEVHASTGSDARSFVVQERLGRKWQTIETCITQKSNDSIYQIPIHKAESSLRIANNTGSSLFIWQIKTTIDTDEVIAEYERQRPIITNFTDGTWGRPTSKKYESGTYPSSEANGFVLHQSYLSSGKITCANDESYTHSGRIILDKDKTGSYFEFPEVEMVGDVEIHALTGSDDRSFVVQELDGKRWKTVATYGTGKKERVFIYSCFKEKTKLRIMNNSGSSLSIYQVRIGRTNAETIERESKLAGLITNFGDGTWGETVSKKPESGDFHTLDVNGFWIYAGVLYKTSSTCVEGGKHYNRLVFDKDQEMARIDFPELTDVGEIEIHASTGSDGKSFEVLEKVGRKWESLGIFNTTKTEQVYRISVNKDIARLRLRNNTSSSLNIYQIKMRTMTAMNSLMLQASAPAQDELVYGNLTRKILLQFSKEMTLGENPLVLNGEPIDSEKIRIKGNIASFRVKVSAGKSHKSYTLDIPQGAFVSALGVQSEKAVINFNVHKTVSVPEAYTSELDAYYSNANILQNRVDVYYPKQTENPVPVVINIHGGGWNHGEKESQTGFSFYFKNNMAVANMEYRMTPDAAAPAALEDVRCVIHYLVKNAERLNIDPHKIILRGASAGGHLALTAGYLGKSSVFDNCMFKGEDFTIAAVLDSYAPADLFQLKDYASLQEWLGDKQSDEAFVKAISPVHLISEDTPPTYIIHGDADPTVAYEQSVMLEKALKEVGVKCMLRTLPGAKHGNLSNAQKKQMEDDIFQFLTELGIL